MTRLVLSLLLLALSVSGQDAKQDDMKDCPMHAQHAAQSHQAVVENHGGHAWASPMTRRRIISEWRLTAGRLRLQ